MNALEYISGLRTILSDMECGNNDVADARELIKKLNETASASNLTTITFTDAELESVEELYEEESSSSYEDDSY